MDTSYLPTHANLMKAKSTLKLSTKGHEILEKKKNILIKEMFKYVEQAEGIKKKADDLFRVAYSELQEANISMGIENVQRIAENAVEDNGISILVRTIMGVEIPTIRHEKQDVAVNYSFHNTKIALDKAIIQFVKIKELILELAQIENTIYRLANAIQKVQKRSNALKNVVIPRIKAMVHGIQSAIEEREREDLARMKVIKGRR